MVYMCPDYQILSVYIDGELPSPWKEKMETHLESCSVCQAQLEQFKRCSQVLKGSMPTPPPDIEAAKERVWRKLGTTAIQKRRRRSIWGRKVSVPLPAVAGAAALCAALVLALTRQPPAAPQNQDAMAGTGMTDVQGIVPVSDMNDVLHYLGNQDAADIVIIRLPESRSFSSSGEPTIIKAADYSRRNGTP
jgi:anti-sigma factor RsiW